MLCAKQSIYWIYRISRYRIKWERDDTNLKSTTMEDMEGNQVDFGYSVEDMFVHVTFGFCRILIKATRSCF